MDIFETLKEYKKLLDADIITQAEFDLKKAELLESVDKTSDFENAAPTKSVKKTTAEEQARPTAKETARDEKISNQNYDADLSEMPNSNGARKAASILCLIGFIVSILSAIYALYFTLSLEHIDTISTAIAVIEMIDTMLVSIVLGLLWRILRKNKGYKSNTIGTAGLVCFVISGLILICSLALVLKKALIDHPSLTFDIVETAILTIAFFIIWRKAGVKNSK